MGEKLEELENGLAELEEGFSQEVVNKLFRAVHTIKGGGGFFGLVKVSELSHVFEDVLMKVREGELAFSESMIGPFYSACDALKGMHEADDFGNNSDINQLCAELRAVDGGTVANNAPSASTSEGESEVRKAEENPLPWKIYQVKPRMSHCPKKLPQNLSKGSKSSCQKV